MQTSRHGTESHHATEADGVSALWSLRGGVAIVWVVRERGSDKPGYRWPDQEQPGWPNGEIAFQPGAYPALEQAREWLPQYSSLWDAIEAEMVGDLTTAPEPGTPAAAHRAFFALPA